MEKRREEYIQLMEVFLTCVQAIDGKKLPPGGGWQADIQPLAIKLFSHLGTIHHLQEGTKLPKMYGVDPEYVDFPSVAAITRCAFETYLAIHYIFFHPDNNTTREFRHKIWKLGGFLDRQKFKLISEEGDDLLAREKVRIEEIRTEIKEHQLYKKMTPEHQKVALKGNWGIKHKWADLAQLAGFHRDYFTTNYAYLSAHAHGSYLSALQVSQAEDQAVQKELTGLCTGIGLILMSYFIKHYGALHKEVQRVIDSNPEYERLVEINYIKASVMEKWFQQPGQTV